MVKSEGLTFRGQSICTGPVDFFRVSFAHSSLSDLDLHCTKPAEILHNSL